MDGQVYEIAVTVAGVPHNLTLRYSTLLDLRNELARRFPAAMARIAAPFPGKKLIMRWGKNSHRATAVSSPLLPTPRISAAVLKERVTQLDAFEHCVIRLCHR